MRDTLETISFARQLDPMKHDEASQLRAALRPSRHALLAVAGLSAVINVLLLGGPIYMLLIYDSVMPSGSKATLFSLLSLILFVYIFQGVFDLLRSRILGDVAAALNARLIGGTHRAMVQIALGRGSDRDDGLGPMRDLDNIRSFLASPGPGALMDLPWLLLFLSLLSLLHIWLGLTASIGALVLITLTVLNDHLSRDPSEHASAARAWRSKIAQDNHRHAELIRALGMDKRRFDSWCSANARLSETQGKISRIGSLISGISRVFRLFLQSLVLTVGALLYLSGEASGAIVFAASILAARALAPIDQAIAHWGTFTAARQSWRRLDRLLHADISHEAQQPATKLPPPKSLFSAEDLAISRPGGGRPILEGVSFTLKAGDALGVVGPSGAGKTTLARALVGSVLPANGSVRLDGATLDQWDPEELGAHLGYVPQHVELFDGTLAQNISRFAVSPPSDRVIKAARSAGVHDLILSFDQGYETQVGAGGVQLSAGQRQRIGLARAIFGDPFLVVLDEPNSNLDADGEAALDTTIAALRANGSIVVLVAHRPSALRRLSHVLVLNHGSMAAFGERDEVLEQLTTVASARDISSAQRTASQKAAE